MDPGALRRLRDGLGYTQARLASLLGVHPLTISRWECGTLSPAPVGLRLLHAIESALVLEPVQLPLRLRAIGADPIRELTAILVILHPDLARASNLVGRGARTGSSRARALRDQIQDPGSAETRADPDLG